VQLDKKFTVLQPKNNVSNGHQNVENSFCCLKFNWFIIQYIHNMTLVIH